MFTEYLKVCKEHGVKLTPPPTVGEKLGVAQKYFAAAHDAIFRYRRRKLAQVLWRKLFPADLENSDDNLINLTFELIQDKEYSLAKTLLDFACSAPMKHADERRRLIFLVNMAQAHKWSGDEAKSLEIARKQDWSATGAEFQLAEAVLLDNFQGAADLVRRIGNQGHPSQASYRTWPIFQKFRRTKEFEAAYQDVFAEPFSLPAPMEKV